MSNYLLGLPFAIVFAFPMGYGVNGLWIGLGIGYIAGFIGLAFIMFTSSWEVADQSIAKQRKSKPKEMFKNDSTTEDERDKKKLLEKDD